MWKQQREKLERTSKKGLFLGGKHRRLHEQHTTVFSPEHGTQTKIL